MLVLKVSEPPGSTNRHFSIAVKFILLDRKMKDV